MSRDEETDSEGTFHSSSVTKTELGLGFMSVSKAHALTCQLLLCVEWHTRGAGVR